MKKSDRENRAVINEFLAVVQEGLISMQTIQEQTAEAHNRFLETQTEAVRTIQTMMEKAQQMADNSFDSEKTEPCTEKQPAASFKTRDIKTTESVFYDVVSRISGYPVEILNSGMDLEADLGIDSIRRIEIISVFEEEVKDITTPDPDMMGMLKTLGEISEYLSELAEPQAYPGNSEAEKRDFSKKGKTETILFDVVSRLTGYPNEILVPEMDLETDLGIDSIKRLEIISVFEEEAGSINPSTPEVIGELKTLGEISAYLSGLSKPGSSISEATKKPYFSEPDPETINETMLGLISKATGYPVDMLNIDMDLETDLGIDLIKLGEIISEIKKEIPALISLDPGHMEKIKTPAQICHLLSEKRGSGKRNKSLKKENQSEISASVRPVPKPLKKEDLRVIDKPLRLSFKKDVDTFSYPFLSSVKTGNTPVVPFALLTEWIGHGALHDNPGFSLYGINNIQLLKGIKIEGSARTIHLMCGNTVKKTDYYQVPVEIRNGSMDNIRPVIHSKATALLSETVKEPPLYRIPAELISKKFKRDMDEVHETLLFHGNNLKGIRSIDGYSSKGMVAKLESAPPPSEWISDPLRTDWVADPLILNSACQMVILWCYEEKGLSVLPSFTKSYRQYTREYPEDGVTAVMEIKDVRENKIKSDFIFLNTSNKVVATISGYEAIMDDTLQETFKNRLSS